MADNFLEDMTNNGNEWDVVSLTASTYAAAPSYSVHNLSSNGEALPVFGGETPRTMFLSDHFVFPPSEHENLPVESDVVEQVRVETSDEETDKCISLGEHDEETDKGIALEEHDEKISILDVLDECDAQYYGETLVERESYQSKAVDVSGQVTSLMSDLLNSKVVEDDKLKPETSSVTWWKRHASSLYYNAKESNSLWSIFVAAAVTGLVIIGQRYQQERWQLLQLKLHLNVDGEKISRLIGPLNRLKDALTGSHHQISFLESSA